MPPKGSRRRSLDLDGKVYTGRGRTSRFVEDVHSKIEELKEFIESTPQWNTWKIENRNNESYDLCRYHLVQKLDDMGYEVFMYGTEDRVVDRPKRYQSENCQWKTRDEIIWSPPEGVSHRRVFSRPVEPELENSRGGDPEAGQHSPQEEWDRKARGYEQDKPDFFDPKDDKDARERRDRSIVYRRGQPQFRSDLMKAYGERCAITDCDVTEALEACHIRPYNGDKTNHVTNGMLLRADLHTLFDKKLFAIDLEMKMVLLAPELKGTAYDFLDRADVMLPDKEACWPNMEALDIHRREAQKTWG